MAGHFVVEALPDPACYDPVVRPPGDRDETTLSLGDPVGLTRMFMLLIGNRDRPAPDGRRILRSARAHASSGAFTNASGLFLAKVGSLLNFVRYRLTMDNSERGGSLKNIHAHYDLSNDLFTSFLDTETLMYSSAIYDAVALPPDDTRGAEHGLPRLPRGGAVAQARHPAGPGPGTTGTDPPRHRLRLGRPVAARCQKNTGAGSRASRSPWNRRRWR